MLTRIQADIWTFTGSFIVIPINLEGVCGRGLAKQMAQKYPLVAESLRDLGRRGSLNQAWNAGAVLSCVRADPYYLALFPVKKSWRDEASLEMISRGCSLLTRLLSVQTH